MRPDETQAGTGWDHLLGAIATAVTLATSNDPTASAGEADVPPRTEAVPWRVHIRALEDALVQKDLSAAERAWHAAHVAAFASRRWDGLVDVGRASLRMGEASGARRGAYVKARELFLSALFLAREQGDADGALRTAEVFATLGDQEVAERCLGVARDLAARAGDPGAEARVRALGQLLLAH